MADLLTSLGVPAQCITHRRSAEEHQRSFRLDLPTDWDVQRVIVDGCWLTGADHRKVDVLFYVTPNSPPDADSFEQAVLLVEFKGKDFGHALSQIEETLLYLGQQPSWQKARSMRRFGIVILSHGHQIPNFQNKIAQLGRRHNVIIRHRSKHMTLTSRDLNLSKPPR